MTELNVETGAPSSAPSITTPPQGGVSVSDDKTLAGGGESPPAPEPKSYWPEDWRAKVAEFAGAGNQKKIDQELRRLEGMTDPTAIYARWREMENTWASRRFVKLPGEDAKPEELAEYHKALGVPEEPEGYLKDLQFDDGLTLGDWDKPAVERFTTAMHEVGAPPAAVKAALHWYLKSQEEEAAALDEADDSFRRVSEQALKNEYGNAYRRYTNNIATLFQSAAGGADLDNENSVYARLLGGRTADGKIIGNDPDFIRWLASLANNFNPAGAVVDDAPGSTRTVEEEIKAIEKRMHEDRKGYFKDEAAQARYRELLEARDKIRARAR